MDVKDLLAADLPPETLVRRGLAALERDVRTAALLALDDWRRTGLVAPELFVAIASLSRPSWGTWNGLLEALRAARRRVLRAGRADERTHLETVARLPALLARLEQRVEAEPAWRPLAEHLHQAVRARPRLARVLTLAIALRNRVAHDAPTSDAAWEEAAVAFRPQLAWYASSAPLQDLLAPLPPDSPFFAVRGDRVLAFHGLDEEFRALLVDAEGRAERDEARGRAVLDVFRRLLGKAEAQAEDLRRLLGRLAPEEIKGVWMGDYLVGRPVGEGGFGRVHVARQLSTGRQVAIKILYDGTPEEVRQRFHQEARYLARFQHPNIVQVLENGRETWSVPRAVSLDGEPWFRETFADTAPAKHYIAMEWVEGRTLEQVFRAGDRPDPRTLARWFADAAGALAAVHAGGLVHRDVKPSNLMVTEDGVVKLMDFGIARSQTEDRTLKTTTGRALGTPAYMAPEQIRAVDAESEVGPRADVYGLCATFYELFSGTRLYAHDRESEQTVRTQKLEGVAPAPPRPVDGRLPWELEALVLGGLEAEAADRPASMADLHADLERFLDDLPIQYRRPSLWRRARLAYRRNRVPANLVAVFLALAVVGIVLYVQGIGREQARTEAQRRLAVTREVESRARLARAYVRSGLDRFTRADDAGALVWFAKALEVEAEDPARSAPHRLRVSSLLRGQDDVVLAFRGLEAREAEPLVISDALLSGDGALLGLLFASSENVSGGQIPCQFRLELRGADDGRVLAAHEDMSLWWPTYRLRFLGTRYLVAFDPENEEEPEEGEYAPNLADYLLALDVGQRRAVADDAVLKELLQEVRRTGRERPAPGPRTVTWHEDVVLVRDAAGPPADVVARNLEAPVLAGWRGDGERVLVLTRRGDPLEEAAWSVHALDPATLESAGEAWRADGLAREAFVAAGGDALFTATFDVPAGEAPVPFPAVPLPDEDLTFEAQSPVLLRRLALADGREAGRWVLPGMPRAVGPDARFAVLVLATEWMYGPRYVLLYDLSEGAWATLDGSEFQGHLEPFRFTTDARWMAAPLQHPRAWGGGVRVWSLADRTVRDLASESLLREIALDPTGRWIAASYEQSSQSRFALARLFALRSSSPDGVVLPHRFQTAAFDPPSLRIVTAEGRRMRVWRVLDGEPRSTFFDHPWPPLPADEDEDPLLGPWVYRLAWSPDGSRLASACGQTDRFGGQEEVPEAPDEVSTVVVWDAASGLPLSRPFATAGRIEWLTFSDDGLAVLVGARDGAVRRCELVADERSAETLLRLAELQACRKVDASETLVDLTNEEVLERAGR